ncbi:MAG: hypothetical protein RL693_1314, partial [Verrucomicrobiota bacterium]
QGSTHAADVDGVRAAFETMGDDGQALAGTARPVEIEKIAVRQIQPFVFPDRLVPLRQERGKDRLEMPVTQQEGRLKLRGENGHGGEQLKHLPDQSHRVEPDACRTNGRFQFCLVLFQGVDIVGLNMIVDLLEIAETFDLKVEL